MGPIWSDGKNDPEPPGLLTTKHAARHHVQLALLEHSIKQFHLSFGVLRDQELAEVCPAEETSLSSQNGHFHPLQSLLHCLESLLKPLKVCWEVDFVQPIFVLQHPRSDLLNMDRPTCVQIHPIQALHKTGTV